MFEVVVLIVMIGLIVIMMVLRATANNVKDRAVSLVVVTLWLIYPDVTQNAFSSLACKTMAEAEPRLYKDMDVVCWEGAHL